MSDKINMNEKAFPFYAKIDERGCPGMTLYDYYLGQAVIAIMSSGKYRSESRKTIAYAADDMAIGMLQVRAGRMKATPDE